MLLAACCLLLYACCVVLAACRLLLLGLLLILVAGNLATPSTQPAVVVADIVSAAAVPGKCC